MKENAKNTTAKFGFGKWFYAFVAAAVLLLAAIITIVVIAVNANKEPEKPIYTEGAETGIYYYDAALGEYTISLNSGCKFTISGPDLNKSGDYALTDNTVTLDFVRDEDGTAQATLEGDTLTLVYQEKTMKFLKKTLYTVTFATDGGSDVAAVTVVNGKAVGKPNDPVKEGNVFLGWYADEALTEAFQFGTAPISGDVTVYAKWAAKVAGQDEYVIDFDLGYEADAPAAIATVGGKLVFGSDYADPTREGYTFVGWFVSDYEDGAKLTGAATEGMAIKANTTLFAVWTDNAATNLKAPAVSVAGNTINWPAVEGANAYAVTIKDAEGNVLFDQSVGTNTQTFDFASAEAGDYEITVVAKGSSAADSDAAVRYYRNKGLGRVSQFTVVGTTLVYNAVDNAQKYLITIDCGNDGHNHTLFDNGLSTNFNLANCEMKQGGIAITVTAVADGYASTTSETYYYVRNLDQVTDILYDEATATFSWATVENAAKYYVTITCGDHTHTVVDNGTATSYSVKGCTGEITISIVPATNGYNSPEATTSTITKETPATPQNIQVSGLTVTWDEAAGAKSYLIKVNGISYNVSGTSYDLADSSAALVAGSKHTIAVQAIGEKKNSIISDTIEATYLVMGSVSYYKNTLTWAPVIGATNFDVRVNGGDLFTVSNTNSTKITLTKAGVNTIEIRPADFASTAEWTAVEVFAYEIVYETRSMNGSAVEYVAVGDVMTLPKDYEYAGFDFDGWYNAPGAAEGNGAEYTELVFTGSGAMTLYANWVPKSYNIEFVGIDGTMSGAATGDKVSVTYTKGYNLPVMTTTDNVRGNFAGWYTGPGGTGTKLTDYLGNSVAPYGVTTDSYAYPYFTSGIILEMKNDNTYAVKKGADVNTIPVITIPAYYNGIPVTSILENGFYNCDYMVEINIPDTIQLIGTGAFNSCDALVNINVYEVETETPHEVFYSSHEGALLYRDAASGYTYLEIFPRAKKGAFTIPAEVDAIRPRAFNYAKISSLTISNEVMLIGDYAFSNCRSLKEIIFEEGGTTPISVSSSAFSGCYSVSKIKLPALIKGYGENEEFSVGTLDSLSALEIIEVEKVTGAYFSAVEGMLCNAMGDTILYCPKAYTGIRGVLSIPKGITAIGDGTFRNRNAFTEIIIPNYVTEIGSQAFYGCRNVTKITIEGSRSRDLSIGSQAFYGCSATREVLFEGNGTDKADVGVTTIGSAAFSGISELRLLTIEKGVNIAEIGASAFAGNIKMRNIDIADGAIVTTIGNGAFKGCEALTSFTIPATTTAIGNSAFADCIFISKIVFAPNGQNIDFGTYVFQNCVSLSSVELPATVQSFDGSAFDGCYSLKNIVVDPANNYLTTINGVLYNKAITEIMFYPKGIDDPTLSNLPWDTLTTIGNTVFKDNSNITSVTIPKNVTKIGDSAFDGCVNLTSVNIAADGTALTVGSYAFANCQKLTTIELPSYTTKIGTGAFYVTPLTAFEIPASVKSIGAKAFMYSNLTTINIPASVELIGDGAFAHTKLTGVTFEEGTAPLAIGSTTELSINYNFEVDDYNTKKAAKVFPQQYDGKEEIGVFNGTALTSVTLPARVTQIGAFAFYDLVNLKTVTIAENSNLTAIGDAAFYGTGLTSINLEVTKLSTVGEFAFTESKLTSVKFPNTITLIDKYAFADIGKIASNKLTPSLTSVEFATGGTAQLTVRPNAFRNSAFAEITFPATLTNCYDRILVGSTDPTYATVMKSFYQIFEGNAKLKAVNVEEGCVLYASHEGVFYLKDENGDCGTLIYCPSAKTGTYTVPKTVTFVEPRAFYYSQLTSISFEELQEGDANYGQSVLVLGSADTSNSSNQQYAVFGGTASSSSGAKLVRAFLYNYNDTVKYNATNKDYIKTTKIAEINFPAHLKTVTSYTVAGIGTSNLKINFNPNSGLVTFYQKAIFSNSGLVELNLPKISSLATGTGWSYTFGSNSKLKTVTFAEGSTFTTLSHSTFYGCSSLTSIEIPASVKDIGQQAFYNCSKLTSITYEDGCEIKSIDKNAFYNTGFTEFVIPDSVTYMGDQAFTGCKNLKKVTIGTGLLSIISSDANGNASSVFRGADYIEEYIVPASHSTLCTVDGVVYDLTKSIVYAYPPAKDPTGYVMPATVKEISYFAFYKFPGSSIELSPSLTKIGYGAFYQSKLASVHIPATVVDIGPNAFYGSTSGSSLKEVTFAENSQLTNIGGAAFYGTSITTIDLPDLVTTVGNSAFGYCLSLKTAFMPSALKELGNSAFASSKKLESITFQNNLETIGIQAFNYCEGLLGIDLPATVTTINYHAFNACKKMAYVNFGEGSRLNYIGYQAFQECDSLTQLIFPEGVSEIGQRAFASCDKLELVDMSKTQFTTLASSEDGYGFFYNCPALKTVLLPEMLEVIDTNCFQNCKKLESIYIPASVTTIRNGAFDGCSSLASVEFSEDSTLTALGTNPETTSAIFRGTTSLKSIKLPRYLTTIGGSVFENSGLESITLPDTLTAISVSAFKNCVNLTEIYVPGSVADIHDQAFQGCTNITKMTLSEGIEYLGANAFGDCVSIKEIIVPSTVVRMGGNPFSNCMGLTNFGLAAGNDGFVIDKTGVLYDSNMRSVIFYPSYLTSETYTMPNTVFELASGAFAGSQLKEITISDNIKVIPAGTFKGSAKLESVTIPLSVLTIEADAFRDCVSLDNVEIPASTTYIGDYAFANCQSLKSFDFGTRNTALNIGTSLFRDCISFEEVILPDTLTAIPEYMFANTGIKNLVIPESVTNLGGTSLFEGCLKLESVTIPETYVGGIGARAFYGCTALKSVVLSDGVTYLGDKNWGEEGETFMNCTSLESVTFGGGLGWLGRSSFENCTSLKVADMSNTGIGATARNTFKNCTSLETVYLSPYYYDIGYCDFEGCVSLKTITFPYCWFYGGTLKGCVGLEEVHITEFDFFENYGYDGENWYSGMGWGNFDGLTSSTKIIFDEYNWEDLMWIFEDMYGDLAETFPFINCEARAFDCDGNEFIYDGEECVVLKVVSPDGEVLWEP